MSFTILTPTSRGRHISKKLNVKTFLFSSSNTETQRCNGRKSRLSKLLSLVQNQLQKFNIREILTIKTCGQKCVKPAHLHCHILANPGVSIYFLSLSHCEKQYICLPLTPRNIARNMEYISTLQIF